MVQATSDRIDTISSLNGARLSPSSLVRERNGTVSNGSPNTDKIKHRRKGSEGRREEQKNEATEIIRRKK